MITQKPHQSDILRSCLYASGIYPCKSQIPEGHPFIASRIHSSTFGCASATNTFSRVVCVNEYSAIPSCSLSDSKLLKADGKSSSCSSNQQASCSLHIKPVLLSRWPTQMYILQHIQSHPFVATAQDCFTIPRANRGSGKSAQQQ